MRPIAHLDGGKISTCLISFGFAVLTSPRLTILKRALCVDSTDQQPSPDRNHGGDQSNSNQHPVFHSKMPCVQRVYALFEFVKEAV